MTTTQGPLFDLEPAGEREPAGDAAPPATPARHQTMIAYYGPGPAGATCGSCAKLIAVKYSRVFFKCAGSRVSASTATDWRRKWPACGQYAQAGDENPQRTIYANT